MLIRGWTVGVSGLVVIDGVPMVEYPRDIRRKVSAAGKYGSLARRRFGMDITWLDDRIAVGGGIWSPENMAKVSLAGITHIIDMQIEFDDTPLAEPHGIAVCWNPVDDDFEFKPPEVFETWSEVCTRGVGRSEGEAVYPLRCWSAPGADDDAGVVGSDGVDGGGRHGLIEMKRPVADFAEVYVRSVEEFLKGRS